MINIPFKPLSERMLQEPFWLGLITVFVVLAIIGLVWCAKRHFPEKIEKLLAEEADRNRRKCKEEEFSFCAHLHVAHKVIPSCVELKKKNKRTNATANKYQLHFVTPSSVSLSLSFVHLAGSAHSHHTSLREQLQFTTPIPQQSTSNSNATILSSNGGSGGIGGGSGGIGGGHKGSIFGRLGIRKPSILSLSSPQAPSCGDCSGAAARTFSLDDLLRPPPRRKTDSNFLQLLDGGYYQLIDTLNNAFPLTHPSCLFLSLSLALALSLTNPFASLSLCISALRSQCIFLCL